ncbi:hypothetical protein J2793_007332 [Paraburkholderia caledonica]|uniref:Uncharacterized protein n=1 Tax=Paraburkholderia caledonica TaxID=134536 RepID=A0AB73IUY5_9BURK|nr:hypothetical protein [Paraburkholderia caledonica]
MSSRWGLTNDLFLGGLFLMRGLCKSINARGFSSRRGDVVQRLPSRTQHHRVSWLR